MLQFLVALAGTLVALPAVLKLLTWRNVVDIANERSSHVGAIHRGGGLACLVGTVASVVLSKSFGVTASWYMLMVVVLVCSIGLFDDVSPLPPTLRLVGLAVMGCAAGWLFGADLAWLAVGIIVLTASVNVVNFMDGINGMTGLTMCVWGGSAMVVGSTRHAPLLFAIGAVGAGAALGFLPANAPVARVFLGDVGSYLFGAMVGISFIVGCRAGVSFILLIAPLSVYLLDTSLTLVHRAWRRQSLLSAHRDHLYQRLTADGGLSHVTVAAFAAGVAACVSAAWIYAPTAVAIPLTILLLACYLGSPALVFHGAGSTQKAPS